MTEPQSAPVPVPAFDLKRAVRRVEPQLAERWRRVLDGTAFVLGAETKEFETAWARAVGAAGCVGVANGTDALVVALKALGLKPGDEVIVPAFSFFATAEAVLWLGATPVFADVEDATLNLDPTDAEHRVSPRTVGVIGVHLYGRPFDADALRALCARHRLWLLEDAAQAQGARWGERSAGAIGDLASWSFYPTKNLGCFGDGGAVTGTDPELLERVRLIANHGQVARYDHRAVGTNSRLDSLQAAVLNCRLPLLAEDNRRRREIACRYAGGLAGLGDLTWPTDPPGAHCVYHQFTVRTARRDALAAHLGRHGVGSSVHYPAPLHQVPAVREWLKAQAREVQRLPVAERAAAEVLCLPMFPELTDHEVARACAVAAEFFSDGAGRGS
jgi:dTDP-4-amino-4,6-dideoxygalactose transaminase